MNKPGKSTPCQHQADWRHDDVVHKEADIFPNAAPMMTPTAKSMTLPRMANSLNSLSISFSFSARCLALLEAGLRRIYS